MGGLEAAMVREEDGGVSIDRAPEGIGVREMGNRGGSRAWCVRACVWCVCACVWIRVGLVVLGTRLQKEKGGGGVGGKSRGRH